MKSNIPVRKIALLGASYNSGNLGVSALAESSLQCIFGRWPDAEVVFFGVGRKDEVMTRKILEQDRMIHSYSIRFCKNIFLRNHFLVLLCYGILFRCLPFKSLQKKITRNNRTLQALLGLDLVADITGGDSFSDIYGMRRFILGFLRKWLFCIFQKPLIFLPQTYGPFKRAFTRILAKKILKKAAAVYSRDQQGLDALKGLLGDSYDSHVVRLVPDVAFALQSRRPEGNEIASIETVRKQAKILFGVNLSGLLYHGGYSQDNMFELKAAYGMLVKEILLFLLKDDNVTVLLVPHVYPPEEFEMEKDMVAIEAVFNELKEDYGERIIPIRGQYEANGIKYFIGQCDYFLGSRMHSCIAALSQKIPTLGLAYSQKFSGVFKTAGVNDYVADLRSENSTDILSKVDLLITHRHEITQCLNHEIAIIQQKIQTLFDEFVCE